MSDGLTISGELDELSTELGALATEIYTLEEELKEIDEQRDDHFNDLLTALYYEYEADEKRRLPGEDVRNALVIHQMRQEEPLLFGQHRRKHKELDRLERKARRLEKRISSKQSQLSYLKTEAMATQ